ncbi:hypothetical protein, conserved [Entamoeba dispar SAW760]|uniref:Uncharacterized protein n=1 Tax=Entamoeba dispar (strain ATCC PRA-260 / SAW760) TaxID=370354 RepID=B0EFW6_ENTDS|nr:uncharacterized protein EDI_059410 [Entamoeba dispar SAW760]EDR26572.1 hypothetical protein, conserved [Entamoeba dispar SAW760]|eukprot:EDR26572.1 hypothetical protein, conserved [Entamoeba dispar SAW760]
MESSKDQIIQKIIQKNYYDEVKKMYKIFFMYINEEEIEKEKIEKIEEIIENPMYLCYETNIEMEYIESCVCDKMKKKEIEEYHTMNCIFNSNNERIKTYCRINYCINHQLDEELVNIINKNLECKEGDYYEYYTICEKYIERKLIQFFQKNRNIILKINKYGWHLLLKNSNDEIIESIVELWINSKDNEINNVEIMKDRLRKLKRNNKNKILKDYIKNISKENETKEEMMKRIIKFNEEIKEVNNTIICMKDSLNTHFGKIDNNELMIVTKETQKTRNETVQKIISERGTFYLNSIVTKEEFEMMERKYQKISNALNNICIGKSVIEMSTKELYEISEYIEIESQLIEEISEENSYSTEDRIILIDALSQNILSYDICILINQFNDNRKEFIQEQMERIGKVINKIIPVPIKDKIVIQHCLYGIKYQISKEQTKESLEILKEIEKEIKKEFFKEEMIILLTILLKIIPINNIIEIFIFHEKEMKENEINIIIDSINDYYDHDKRKCIFKLNQIQTKFNFLILLKFLIVKEIIEECKEEMKRDLKDALSYLKYLNDEYSKKINRNELTQQIMNIICYNEIMKHKELIKNTKYLKLFEIKKINLFPRIINYQQQKEDVLLNENSLTTLSKNNLFQPSQQIKLLNTNYQNVTKSYDVKKWTSKSMESCL